MGEQARRYSWAPFEAGNAAGVRHGAWSERRLSPLAAELVAGLLADRPDLAGYPEVVAAWARAEARCELFDRYLADEQLDGANALKVARHVTSFERLADSMRQRLGLDPRSEAELVRERAEAGRELVDLEAIRARGRAALQRRNP
jgi:hypothetical protein